MKSSKTILSLVIMLAPFIFLKSKLEDLNLEKAGRIVPMKIVEKPYSCIGTKAKWFMKVEYQGNIYSKQIGGQFCEEHKIGDVVEMKFLETSTTVLFPHESVSHELFALFLMSFIGLSSLIYNWLIKKKS